ncbi:thioesterase II family protein [Sphingobacterium kitahiroshimense]|uniref:Alpha/beta fold hydrolase n=1 Tax=Sphingobacterium kitahiroshimense TaxID=470446 RepID=A0ABV0BLZ4_9SPHI
MIHFAGGNIYSFQDMISHFNMFEVIPLELPGRGKRIGEGLVREFDLAAMDLYDQIAKKLNGQKFSIFGHSMGAYLGLRISNMLEKAGELPDYLIVSGNPGPGIINNRYRYLMDEDMFIKELASLGGMPDGFLENDELFEFYEPILRADFEIAENNKVEREPPINAPILAIMGSREEKVSEISNWRRFTTSRFNFEILEGGHFFIHKQTTKVARLIEGYHSKLTGPPYQV